MHIYTFQPKIVLLCFIMLSSFTLAQNSIQPEEITIKDGLSQGFISSMIQDKEGFLWFGTKNGLNRYDGEHFQVFVNDRENPYSISGDFIRSLYEEGDFILVGTHQKGLSIYHKQSRRFYEIPDEILGQKGRDIQVADLLKDVFGRFWFVDSINDRLVRIEFPDNFWELLPNDESVLHKVKSESIPFFGVSLFNLNKNNNRIIVCAANLGDSLALWNIDVQSLKKEKIIPELSANKAKIASIIFFDEEQIIINESEEKTGNKNWNSRIWNYKKNTWQNPKGYKIKGSLLINDIYVGIGTNSDEWFFYNKDDISLPSFKLEEALFKLKIKGVNLISSLIDGSGNLWLGTNGYGVLKITSRKSSIKSHGDIYFGAKPYISIDGEIIVDIGTNNNIKAFYISGKKPKFIKNGVLDFMNSHNSTNIWNGKDDALWVSGTERSSFKVYQIPKGKTLPKQPTFLMSSDATAFGRDDERNLVLFASKSEFISYYTQNKQVKKYSLEEVLNNKYQVYDLAKTRDGRWWLGTSGGLLECRLIDNNFQFKLFKETDNQSIDTNGTTLNLLNNNIASLLTDPKDANILWMGTKGGGLHRLDTKAMVLTYVTSKDGLPNDVIYSVLNDDEGNLWMSSNKGIISYNPSTGKILNYTEEDGMQGNEFNTWSYAKSPNGEFVFGGVKGLNVFHPNNLRTVKEVPNVSITGLYVNNENISVNNDSTSILKNAINFTKEITLPFSENSIALQFAGLEYTAPTKNKFRYYLEGIEEPWVHESDQNEASYLSLPPNNYTFKIKGANGDGVWSNQITELKINILPPWYRTNLAYLLYSVFIGFSVFKILKLQKSRIQLQFKSQVEHREVERLKELDQVKSKLYTNITHEFRTPLTVISGIADQLKNSGNKNLIKRNSDQLLNLINQMLDLRKIESGEISIQKKQDDIIKYLRYQTESLKSLAEAQELTVHFLSDEKSLFMDFDAEKIMRIHSNLLSNAIKFTPKGGDIYVQLSIEEAEVNRAFLIKIRDTGIGISEKQLPRIFERFYQVDDTSTRKGEGTGIGLTLVSELTKAMGGDINVTSTKDEGTTFIIKLPITNIAEHNDTNVLDISNTSMISAIAPSQLVKTSIIENSKQILPTVLIVEDNADVIHYLISCLKDFYNIEIAMNGEEGIEKAITNVPDIIVSDVMMPIKDGFELCKVLKIDERTSHIPIILLTAKADAKSRLEGLQRGADTYLSKPFHKEELLIILQSKLELRKTLQSKFMQFTNESSLSENEHQNNKDLKQHIEIEDVFLQKIRTIIEEDLSNSEIGILQLVRGIGMSRSQIFKKVKALTGNSPSIYMRSIRLHHAQKLLKTTNFNVSEIAYKVGFSSPVYFSDVYLETFGYRPTDDRG
ncbi:ATP-binding protein [Winogradskyella sp.]|uniref:hybrid sensor histidine kinase/response regulator transcription factor n=1 Tax=Winogradskyella sp. TaxID=1883156 RepID=UPI0025D98D04|nr:ATP-binding protein [Winogradskyella sp.]